MIWAFAVAAAAILYLALRFRRFQSWVEPVLTIVVAIGLASALLIWFVEDRAPSGDGHELAGDAVLVLEPGVGHVGAVHAGLLGEPVGGLEGGEAALGDAVELERALALERGLVTQQFGDAKI